jgi:hypothetical protein
VSEIHIENKNGPYQSVLVPRHTSSTVGIGVRVAFDGAGLTAEEAVQVRTDLVGTAGLGGVALSAASLGSVSVLSMVSVVVGGYLEEVGTLAGVTWWNLG